MNGEALPSVVWALGTEFSDLDLNDALRVITARPSMSSFAYVCTPNAVHVVNYARNAPGYRAGIDAAWLRLCDSRVLARLMMAAFGLRLKLAVGSDLTLALLQTGISEDDDVTVIGGDAMLADRLRTGFGLHRIALHAPPFGFAADPAALAKCVAFVRSHPARYVFLACGAPQSELLGAAIVDDGGCSGTGLCIGSSLLFATGLAVRAPAIWQRAGLEWLHRLLQEPGRLGSRLAHSQLPLLKLIFRYRLDPLLRRSQGRPDFTGPR